MSSQFKYQFSEILSLITTAGKQELITDDENVKVFTYEDNSYSDYVKLATTKTISFRVKKHVD